MLELFESKLRKSRAQDDDRIARLWQERLVAPEQLPEDTLAVIPPDGIADPPAGNHSEATAGPAIRARIAALEDKRSAVDATSPTADLQKFSLFA